METPKLLFRARRKAGLSQRELAERTGIAQPTIARIESGAASPRCETLGRLLDACGYELELTPYVGAGIDRTAMRELLAIEPAERLRLAAAEARALDRLLESRQ
ncbi:MAG: helix-turn-helix domain-containing protein [Thermoanaerobaculia bacterium]